MSIHIPALRDIAANYGWLVCDEAADEIERLESECERLAAENANFRQQLNSRGVNSDGGKS